MEWIFHLEMTICVLFASCHDSAEFEDQSWCKIHSKAGDYPLLGKIQLVSEIKFFKNFKKYYDIGKIVLKEQEVKA